MAFVTAASKGIARDSLQSLVAERVKSFETRICKYIVMWHLGFFPFKIAVCRPQSLTTVASQADGIRELPGSALFASLLLRRSDPLDL